MRFDEIGFDPALMLGIRDMRYEEATPIQEQAIPAVLGGRDVIGLAQTGTGKTAAFLLPILQKVLPGNTGVTRALILAPTRELASQIDDVRVGLTYHTAISGALVLGGANADNQERALKGVPDIVIATPGRLLDFLFRGLPKLDKVEIVVLDEADRMLDMGFLPDIEKILRRLPDNRQNLMFSATMPPPIEKLAREIMRDPVTISIGARSRPVDRIRHIFERIQPHFKARRLADALRDRSMESVIVFTKTKSGADRLWRDLIRYGIHDSIAIHGDRTQQERFHALELFKSRQIRVLIATDVAARGIDVDSVSHVVNYDLPRTFEDYVHRVGRTARAGESGIAVTLVTPEEERAARRYEHAIDEMRAKSRASRSEGGEPPRDGAREPESREPARPDEARREPRHEPRRNDRRHDEPRRERAREGERHPADSRRSEPHREGRPHREDRRRDEAPSERQRPHREHAGRRDDAPRHAREDAGRHAPRREDERRHSEPAHAERPGSDRRSDGRTHESRSRDDRRDDPRHAEGRRGHAPRDERGRGESTRREEPRRSDAHDGRRPDDRGDARRHEERPARGEPRREERTRHESTRPDDARRGEPREERRPSHRGDERRHDERPARQEPRRDDRRERGPGADRSRDPRPADAGRDREPVARRDAPPARSTTPSTPPRETSRSEPPAPRPRAASAEAPTNHKDVEPTAPATPAKKATRKVRPRATPTTDAPAAFDSAPTAESVKPARKTKTTRKKSVLDDEIPTTTGPDD